MPSGYEHGDTPKRAMVRGTISYLESQSLPVNKSAIFRHFGLSRSQGYAALSAPTSKRNNPEWEETRGRPSKIVDRDLQRMEGIVWDEAYETVNLNWAGFAKLAGLEMDFSPRTLHRNMGTLGYRRCLGCPRSWVHQKCREKRIEWAKRLLKTYPDPEDWRRVRFSGELHFGFGLDGAMRLLPRSGEKYCPDCVKQGDAPSTPQSTETDRWSRDVRKIHAWAAVGHDFKSELIFYEDSTSPNVPGALSMADYRDKILDKIVGPWLQPAQGGAQSFVLEEDADSSAHGNASKVNLVQQWRDAAGLRSYFTCGDSPDLSPLDSLWPPHKQWRLREPLKEWDEAALRRAAREAWDELVVAQNEVNVWVELMPARLSEVAGSQGAMVSW